MLNKAKRRIGRACSWLGFRIDEIAYSEPFSLLRQAFISLLPIVLAMNAITLVLGVASLLQGSSFSEPSTLHGVEFGRLYFFLKPLFLNISLSLLLARVKKMEEVGTVLISALCFFEITGFIAVSEPAEVISHRSSILTSIPVSWAAVSTLHFFSQFQKLRLIDPRLAINPRVVKSINVLIPGLLTLLCFQIVKVGNQWLLELDFLSHLTVFHEIWLHDLGISHIPELIIFKLIAQICWFLGIHGEHGADGFFRFIHDTPAGTLKPIYLKGFHDVFMNIGGTGSTFVIPLLLLARSSTTYFQKAIARLSLPFAVFNVNEVLLFGLPIVLNPTFLIPFLTAPFVNMLVTLLVMSTGAFTINHDIIQWMMPPFYGAYVISDGSWWAVLTQFACLVIDACIYYPFVVSNEERLKLRKEIPNLFRNDTYEILQEEIALQEERLFFTQQLHQVRALSSLQKTLQKIQDGEFILYYQLQISAKNGEPVGLEALLRFKDSKGNILSPTFLPVLYERGLSRAVDRKVVSLVLEQVRLWRLEGVPLPTVSINFDKEFLLDPQAVRWFINETRNLNVSFCLEITEHTYTRELDNLAVVVCQLRKAGHRVSIDDFGAGYSSLTSLLALEADEIKLDRKLLAHPNSGEQREKILLESSARLCHNLGFSVVAEGVENLEQVQLLQKCGVNVLQGFYIAKPLPPSQVAQLLKGTYQKNLNLLC